MWESGKSFCLSGLQFLRSCHKEVRFPELVFSNHLQRDGKSWFSRHTLLHPTCSVFSLLLCSFRTGVEHRQAHHPGATSSRTVNSHPLSTWTLIIDLGIWAFCVNFLVLCPPGGGAAAGYTSTPWVSSFGKVNGWFSSTHLALILCFHLDEWFGSSCLSPGGTCRGRQRTQPCGSPLSTPIMGSARWQLWRIPLQFPR